MTVQASVPGVLERPAQLSPHAQNAVLIAVTATSARLVAVGERGIVVLSDDNGLTWRQANVPVSVTLTAVQFLNDQDGWIVGHGGVVLRSQDGGESWTRQMDGLSLAQLLVRASQERQQSKDADPDELEREAKAAQLMVKDGPDKPFLDVHFVNERTGYIIGAYNLILRTDDGGKTWQPWQSHVDNPMGLHLYAIGGGAANLYLVGEQGSVFRSSDDGGTFVALETPYQGSYFNLLVDSNDQLIIAGLRGSAYRTDDSGTNWTRIDIPSGASITGSVQLKDGRLVLVNQSGQLLVSQDKGNSFQLSPLKQLSPLAGVTQSADGSLIVVGVRGVTTISLASVTGSAK
ncbi:MULTISPECIES: WD40/YVTN/BNR-like repeat-containing protein [unclassified Pseudomonas]|uniref:WD40/YVTN/BNR-like repeat-containing protein n=1 Tax=unclassified Pseudomonas TaxID=196821 RepID=UPI00384D59AA